MPSAPIQRRPYRALVRAFLLAELRSPGYGDATGSKPGAMVAPFTWVVGQMLTMSLLLCVVLFMRVEPGFFAAANLLLCGVSVFAAVAVEFHEAALHPDDRTVLAWRPVSARTYSAARSTTLAAYVMVVTACLTVLPATVGAGQWGAGAWWLPLYTVASFAVGLSAASLVLLLHLGLGAGPVLDGLRAGLSWLQILGVMVGFYGGQLMLRNSTGNLEMFAFAPPSWLGWIPTTPLGIAVAQGSRAPIDGLVEVGVAVAVAGALATVGWMLLARAWGSLRLGVMVSSGSAPATPVRGTLAASGAARLVARSGRAKHAAVWLARTMLLRDRELLNRSLPALATGAAAATLGLLTGQFGDPLDPGTTLTHRVLPLATVALLASAVPSLLHNALYSRDHAAAWRLRTAPLPSPAALAEGLRMAMLGLVGLPSVLALTAVACLRWQDPLHAVSWGIGTWLILDLIARLMLPTVVRDVPFSRPASRGVALGPVAIPIAAAGSLATGIATLGSLAAGRPALLAALLLALLLARPLVTARTRERLDQRLSGARS